VVLTVLTVRTVREEGSPPPRIFRKYTNNVCRTLRATGRTLYRKLDRTLDRALDRIIDRKTVQTTRTTSEM